MDRFGGYIESVRCFCQAGVVDKMWIFLIIAIMLNREQIRGYPHKVDSYFNIKQLPDDDTVRNRTIHGISAADSKGFVEVRNVHERSICPVSRRRVRIADHALTLFFLSHIDGPYPCI